jgi:RNA polymerase sigma-70 factor, ECF subfamily
MLERPAVTAEALDFALLSAVARGERDAVDKLYRLHGEAVMRFVYRRVEENFEDAQEITADTFISALSLAAGFNPNSTVLTWLCGIAKLRIVDFYRRRQRSKRIPAAMTQGLEEVLVGTASLEKVLDRLEAKRAVDALFETLREDEREAILLRYAEGFSLREAARMMNRSERGVDSLLTRAKQKARAAVDSWKPGGEL